MDHPVPAGWLPASPCTPSCLAIPATTRSYLQGAIRLTAAASVLAVTAATAPLLPISCCRRWLRAGARSMLRVAGVRVRLVGVWPEEEGVLLVANHLSWIDVLALACVANRGLAGHRLPRPLRGRLFLDRAGLRGLPAVIAALAAALRSGADVAVFPEGTTWCGAAAGPFRRAAFDHVDAAAYGHSLGCRVTTA